MKAPDLYISQTALKELFPQYRVFRVAFDTDGQHDESILQELKQITASQANIDIISRYERREEMQEYLITAKVLGTIGTAIFILLYMIFSKVAYYAVFSYPFIPLVLVSGLVLLICLIVPIWVYKTDVNLPVVERLRLTE